MTPGTRGLTEEKNGKPRLRKPSVEKKRRDRINTGIQRLKLLLKNELSPKYKLVKAYILETAVDYLKKNKAVVARAPPQQCYTVGFTRCLEESARFLVTHNNRAETGEHVMRSGVEWERCGGF